MVPGLALWISLQPQAAEDPSGPHADFWDSFCVDPSSLLYSATQIAATSASLKLDLQSLQIKEICPCVPVFPPLPEPWLSNCLQAESHDKSHLLCFSSCRDHSPVPSVAQCLKTAVSHILSSFLIVYCRRASLVLVNPSFMTSGRNF